MAQSRHELNHKHILVGTLADPLLRLGINTFSRICGCKFSSLQQTDKDSNVDVDQRFVDERLPSPEEGCAHMSQQRMAAHHATTFLRPLRTARSKLDLVMEVGDRLSWLAFGERLVTGRLQES